MYLRYCNPSFGSKHEFFLLPLTEFDFGNNIIYSVKREKCVGLHKIQDFFPVI